MKRRMMLSMVTAMGLMACGSRAEAPAEMALKTAVETYFNGLFQQLGKAAGQAPTDDTFRTVMKPLIENVDGLFGATLINADWEIRAVYFKRDFLAVGFSLKKVKELDGFRALMAEKPAPQLSEPGHGNIVQPRLIAMRYPVIRDGKMVSMVSMMIRTESFLKAVGLRNCKAFKIICNGKEAESAGTLSEKHKEVNVALPSTEWVIQYE